MTKYVKNYNEFIKRHCLSDLISSDTHFDTDEVAT